MGSPQVILQLAVGYMSLHPTFELSNSRTLELFRSRSSIKPCVRWQPVWSVDRRPWRENYINGIDQSPVINLWTLELLGYWNPELINLLSAGQFLNFGFFIFILFFRSPTVGFPGKKNPIKYGEKPLSKSPLSRSMPESKTPSARLSKSGLSKSEKSLKIWGKTSLQEFTLQEYAWKKNSFRATFQELTFQERWVFSRYYPFSSRQLPVTGQRNYLK